MTDNQVAPQPSRGPKRPPGARDGQPTSEVAARRPTLFDVARVVGVSHQTVSRVVNRSGNVHPRTRLNVLKAIEELGYRPNTAARTLVTQRSGTIGLITSDVINFGPSSTLAAVEQAAREQGLNLSLCILRDPGPRSFSAALDTLQDQHVDAVVLIAGGAVAAGSRVLSRCKVPVVIIEGTRRPGALRAGLNHRQGARLVTDHLLGLGHDSVVHIAGPPQWSESQARIQGWRSALQQAGRPVPLLRWRGDWSPLSGYRIGRRILEDERNVTAIFAANDQMALGLLRALSEAGVAVPTDISVVGFDDLPEGQYLTPPLTTVRQDFTALGRLAIRLAQEALEGEASPRAPLVPAELVLRCSAAAPSVHRQTGSDPVDDQLVAARRLSP